MLQLATLARTRRVAPVLLLAVLAACSRQQAAAPDTAAATANAPATPAVSATVQSMGTGQLHASAGLALRENRMYAPAGANAVEYYLALRDKQPDDAEVKSALTDLMPYTLIAAEQGISRGDFPEAQRLIGLIEKMDPQAPALPRLQQGLRKGMQAMTQRNQEQTDTAGRGHEHKAKLAAAQQAQQRASAAQAAQQRAAQEEAARRENARQQADRQAAASLAMPAALPPAATPAAIPLPVLPAPEPAVAPAAASTQTLRPISTPAPRYPPEALRSRIAGEVLVEITVGTDGAVTNARVLRATPPRVFDREALNAAKRWRFEPVGTPVTTRRTLAFDPGG